MNESDNSLIPLYLVKAFALMGNQARLQIILVINDRNVCVCHLEKVLGLKQAYISQHLMQLRKEGFVETERIGRHIFYHLTDVKWIEIIRQAAKILQVELPKYDLPSIQGCEFKS